MRPLLGGGSGLYLVEVGQDAELGAHLWYGILELLDPLLLLCFLFGRHSPLTLNQTDGHVLYVREDTLNYHRLLSSSSYLLLPLSLLLLVLQSEGELLQRRAVERVLGALELDDLIKNGSELVQKRLSGQRGTVQGHVCVHISHFHASDCVFTLLLLSSRHREMMVSRKTSCAAMMWSRS